MKLNDCSSFTHFIIILAKKIWKVYLKHWKGGLSEKMTYRTYHNSLKFLNYIKFKNRSGTFLTPCIYMNGRLYIDYGDPILFTCRPIKRPYTMMYLYIYIYTVYENMKIVSKKQDINSINVKLRFIYAKLNFISAKLNFISSKLNFIFAK